MTAPATPLRWRERIMIHPAAELFPLLLDAPGDALPALAEDIKAHGLLQPIVLWSPAKPITAELAQQWRAAVAAGEVPTGLFLLDGRNRLDALQIGVPDPETRREALGVALGNGLEFRDPVIPAPKILDGGTDPYRYAVSANLHRRQLSLQQRRELAAKLLQLSPGQSDRQVARELGLSPSTIGAIRRRGEADGAVSKMDTRTGADGVVQPAHKPAQRQPTRQTAPAPAGITTGATTGTVSNLDTTAPQKTPPAKPAAPSDMAAALFAELAALDPAVLLIQLERLFEEADETFTKVNEADRIAFGRLVCKALALDLADLADAAAIAPAAAEETIPPEEPATTTPERKTTKANGATAWKHVAWTATKAGYKKVKGEAKRYVHPETGDAVEIHPGAEPGTIGTDWTHTHAATGEAVSGHGYRTLQQHLEAL